MKVKDFKKLLKGMDECELCVRAYDEQGWPNLLTDFAIETIDTFQGFNDPSETRIVVISPDYYMNDTTRETGHED
jgi:hypothetical protein